jgi:8-oxo-dGTP pyrophosphatase MutT (NUDIX family)
MRPLKERKFLGATVSAIIERFRNNEWQVLLQTRWKPEEDAKHSGLLEIPGGRIELGEDVYEALKREIEEECGLVIESIKPGKQSVTKGKFGEVSVAFVPFCGERFLGSNYVGFVFVCSAEGTLRRKGLIDGKEPRWVSLAKLRKLLQDEPEKLYSYHLSALRYYVEQKEKGLI